MKLLLDTVFETVMHFTCLLCLQIKKEHIPNNKEIFPTNLLQVLSQLLQHNHYLPAWKMERATVENQGTKTPISNGIY